MEIRFKIETADSTVKPIESTISMETISNVNHLKKAIKESIEKNFPTVLQQQYKSSIIDISTLVLKSKLTCETNEQAQVLDNQRETLVGIIERYQLIEEYDKGDDNLVREIFAKNFELCVSLPVLLPRDVIDSTLDEIINRRVVDYNMHIEDTDNVRAIQKRMLGPFFKDTLPYVSESKMNLVMLGHVINEEPMTKGKRKISEVIEDDFILDANKNTLAMVARSGSGKTATIVQLARQHFIIYVMCDNPYSRSPEFSDLNFRDLVHKVTEKTQALNRLKDQKIEHLQSHDSIDYEKEYAKIMLKHDEELKLLLREHINIEILARHMFLLLLFTKDEHLTPEQFFRKQINGGTNTIAMLVKDIHQYDSDIIMFMFTSVKDRLKRYLRQNRALIVALDEAQVADSQILNGELISPTAIKEGKDIFNRMGIIDDYRRGFLTSLCSTISGMGITLMVLGTSLSLTNADHVYSSVDKENTRFERITHFLWCDEDKVDKMLENTIDMTGCQIPPEKKRKLTGRPRFTISLIAKLINMNHSNYRTKQEALNKAIDLAISQAKKDLQSHVNRILNSDKSGAITHLLSRMVIASKLMKNKIVFSYSKEVDFVESALCEMEVDEDAYHWIMSEPLVIEVVEEELKNSDIGADFLEYLEQFNSILTYLGPASSVKERIFDLLVAKTLQNFNGTIIADLPFVKNTRNHLPAWCYSNKLQTDGMDMASQLGYSNGVLGDDEYFENPSAGYLLFPNIPTRPDGESPLSSNRYWMSLVIKLWSSLIDLKTHEPNTSSSDLRLCSCKGDGDSNESRVAYQKSFQKSSDIRGILCIHIVLPGIQSGTPDSHVSGEDVLVYIDEKNMNDFFIENGNEYMKILSGMIKYVLKSKEELEQQL